MATKGLQRAARASPPPPPPPAAAAIPHDRLVFLLLALVGTRVVATLKGGHRYSGILAAATADGDVSLALRQAQLVDQPDSPLRPSLLIQAKDLHELEASDINLEASSLRAADRSADFKTDTEVTGSSLDRKEKQLQAWGAAGDELELGGLSLDDERGAQLGASSGRGGGAGGWDQFAANERITGARTDYHEEIYTTKLDRSGADYRARELRAAQLEREILKGGGLVNNAHVAEERNIVDDSGLTEEDRYSGVIRGSGAYVPPGARKTPLSRPAVPNGNGPPSAAAPAPAPAAPTMSLAASAASAKAQDPSIMSITSRLPVSSSSTSRIPAAAPAGAAGAEGGAKSTAPTVEGSFRQFVSAEKQRLTEKKNAAAKAAERQDKDSKLASLLEFSQTFKLRSPMPADIAEIAGHGERKPIPASSTLSATTTSASTVTSPVVSPARVARPLTPAAAAPLPGASKPAPRFVASSSNLIAEIPPFNPNRSKVKPAAVVAAPALDGKAPSAAAAAATPAASGSGSGTKINPNAPAFVFRPNPNASSFTPGFSPAASTSTLTARKPAAAPSESQAPLNPFFGHKQIKKGSSSMHVKEDFTPFKTGVVHEPGSIVPGWAFTGKPYRSMYPLAPTPPPMGMMGMGMAMGMGMGMNGEDDGGAPHPQQQQQQMHPGQQQHMHAPPQGYGVGLGGAGGGGAYGQQFQQQQHPQDGGMQGGGGAGPGGYNPRFGGLPQMHMPPPPPNGPGGPTGMVPPPPPPQFGHFPPPPPPPQGPQQQQHQQQGMGYGQPSPNGVPQMFNSPQMQHQQAGAYMRYTPFPHNGGGPPQQQQQQ